MQIRIIEYLGERVHSKTAKLWALTFALVFCVLTVLIINIWTTFPQTEDLTVPSVVAVLSTSAPVAATLAGFLFVAMVFLFERRKPDWYATKSLWSLADVVFFASAIVLFCFVAMNAVIELGYVVGKPEVDSRVLRVFVETTVLLRIAMAMVASGFGFAVATEYLKMKLTA